MKRFLTILLAVTLVVFGACAAPVAPAAPSSPPASAEGKVPVVVTFSILADLVRNVGGDKLSLTTLVEADSDTHTFEPSPADGVALVNASLIFENGFEFETWLDDLYSSSGSQAKRVAVSEGIEPRILEEGEEGADHADEQGRESGHEHGEFDPHTWHDVKNVMHMVEMIRDTLVVADAANADTYRANADAYLSQLQTLDAWVIEQVATLPEARRKLITTHDTFGYFADRYGFVILGSALSSISTEAGEPAAADFVALVEEIKASAVPAIFAETVSNPEITQRLADEAGVKLAPLLYTDALGATGSESDSYLKLMRYNVTTIVEALK